MLTAHSAYSKFTLTFRSSDSAGLPGSTLSAYFIYDVGLFLWNTFPFFLQPGRERGQMEH